MDIINILRQHASKSPCKVIKFAATDGKGLYSHNGQYYADCDDCKRTEIEQPFPDCKANHAEWAILNYSPEKLYIYCMTPDGKDYPFIRFWCRTCAILIPMFGVKEVYLWNGESWDFHDPKRLIEEVDTKLIVTM